MNANEVIESYVSDVALQLPRKQRNDVAYELRALIGEGLQDRAEAAGREPDSAMAIAFLREFGRPDEVAARYRPHLSIIDPADAHAFLRASVIGLLIIWGLGLWSSLSQPIDPGVSLLSAFGHRWGHWWGSVFVPSLWWPGMLVTGYALAAWIRRRWPQTAQWEPRSGDRIQGGRAAMVLALVGMACGLYILIQPTVVLDLAFGGRAAPVAYQALTYTDTFLQRQAPWMFALLLLNLPFYATVMIRGRWSPTLRRIETVLALLTCAAMLWVIVDGPVMMTQTSDRTAKALMALIVTFSLLTTALLALRKVKPAPDRVERA